ncbi:HupC [Halomonas huangheensis]|nr:HupC [Halomonas huangheensis]
MIKRHSSGTRAWHWINLAALIILLMSGLQIFNAHPTLYWGDQSLSENTVLAIGARRTAEGEAQGYLQISDYRFDTTGVLGWSRQGDDYRQRGFPAWATLPSSQWLAMGRNWHFFAAWIFGTSLVVYLLYSLVRRNRRRQIFPRSHQWRQIKQTFIDHARFRFHHVSDYNVIQKLTYIGVLFGLLPMLVLSGLAMSPTMDAAWPWLPEMFGGRQSARTIHFIGAVAIVLFVVIHVGLVVATGLFNNLRSMVTGTYRINVSDEANQRDE